MLCTVQRQFLVKTNRRRRKPSAFAIKGTGDVAILDQRWWRGGGEEKKCKTLINSHPGNLTRCTAARKLPPTRVRPQQRSACCQLVFKLSGFNCVEPPYLLSQCKHRSLAPPPSWSELHSAFSWTRIASFHSCASFSPLVAVAFRCVGWALLASWHGQPASQCGA